MIFKLRQERHISSRMNQLYYGDNLHVLRDHIADASVDLIYLDPPFNSKRDYNLLFKSPVRGRADLPVSRGEGEAAQQRRPTTDFSTAQIEAFEDTWHWNEQAEREYDELLHQPNTDIAEMN